MTIRFLPSKDFVTLPNRRKFFMVIFCVCDLGVHTHKFDGWVVQISYVNCVSYQNNIFNKHLKFILYFY